MKEKDSSNSLRSIPQLSSRDTAKHQLLCRFPESNFLHIGGGQYTQLISSSSQTLQELAVRMLTRFAEVDALPALWDRNTRADLL